MTISAFEFLKLQTPDFRYRVLTGAVAFFLASAAFSDDRSKPSFPALSDGSKLPFKQQTDTDTGVTLRVLGGLIIVVLLGYGAVFGIKRYFPSVIGHSTAGQRKINVLETRRLTPKTTLFLIEVEGARLLLAQSGDRITSLHRAQSPQASEPGHGESDCN